MSAKELQKDLIECTILRSQATRPHMQKVLDVEMAKLKKLIENNKIVQGKSDMTPQQLHLPNLPKQKITTYAWDQSDKFLKIYVTIPGVEVANHNDLTATYATNAVVLSVNNYNGKDYEMTISDLLYEINPNKSHIKQKKDTILIMLKKCKENVTWDTVTKMEKTAAEKKIPKFDEKTDPQESLMSMMKQMYDEGDDEMKRTIKKAWHQSQETKAKAGDEWNMDAQ